MVITGDYVFVTLVLLALGLMLIHLRERTMLMALASSALWLGIGLWLFLSDSAPLDIEENWARILAWVFFGILTWIPWVNQINTEIRHEARGKRWSTYGAPPKEQGPNRKQQYRERLRTRLR